MNIVTWHYSKGVKIYFEKLFNSVGRIGHNFSLFILLKSFFAPWKRMLMEDEMKFDITKFFQNLVFNTISRSIGVIVRFFLILVGLVVLLIVFTLGILFFPVFLLFPLFSLGWYYQNTHEPEDFLLNIKNKIKKSPDLAYKFIFETRFGNFVLEHLGQDVSDLLRTVKIDITKIDLLKGESYEELTNWFLNLDSSLDQSLSLLEMTKDDIVLSARWWDQKEKQILEDKKEKKMFGRPGIGLELLFGYTPLLDKYSEDLNIEQPFSHHLIGRKKIVEQMERIISTGKSVFLTGQPGVGRRAVILEFVKRADLGQLGNRLAYSRVMELNYEAVLAEAVDLNAKKVKLGQIMREASSAGNIILVIKDLYRLTNSEIEGYDFTDVFERYLESGNLKIIAVLSQVEYERFISRDQRLIKFFEPVEVVQPTKDEAMSILMLAANKGEMEKKKVFLIQSLKRILEGSDSYITNIPFPEKALEILDEVLIYNKDPKGIVTVDDVNAVISEKTGISLARLTENEKEKLASLEEVLGKNLVGQETAISLISKSLRSRTLGIKSENRPVGSFLFLGPTGVGKTQTAKVLAQVYYGDAKNIIRFDMAEFAGGEGISRLIGSEIGNQQGLLTSEIKKRPASLLLFDEIEKAPKEVYNLFLSLLDEGVITDAFGEKIICKHLFVIATSNAGSVFIKEAVDRGISGKSLTDGVLEYVQTKGIFSPEFLNRFDGVVVYEPLKQEQTVEVAKLLLKELKDNLLKRNIFLEFGEGLADKVARDGFDPAMGARPMRRVIDLVISDVLSKAILSGKIKQGDKIVLLPGENKDEYLIKK